MKSGNHATGRSDEGAELGKPTKDKFNKVRSEVYDDFFGVSELCIEVGAGNMKDADVLVFNNCNFDGGKD